MLCYVRYVHLIVIGSAKAAGLLIGSLVNSTEYIEYTESETHNSSLALILYRLPRVDFVENVEATTVNIRKIYYVLK